uniref:Chloride ion channel protein n=1 Tax=Clostridioides difficile TaxID=1496 RepID=A0A381I6Q1_CLODI|nr:chloride ion channel protein [Clostridioides difficile]
MIEKFKTLIWIKMIIRIKSVYKTYGGLFFLGLIGIPVGAIIGLIDTIFGTVLLKVTDIRETYPMYLIPFLAVVGVVIAYAILNLEEKVVKE